MSEEDRGEAKQIKMKRMVHIKGLAREMTPRQHGGGWLGGWVAGVVSQLPVRRPRHRQPRQPQRQRLRCRRLTRKRQRASRQSADTCQCRRGKSPSPAPATREEKKKRTAKLKQISPATQILSSLCASSFLSTNHNSNQFNLTSKHREKSRCLLAFNKSQLNSFPFFGVSFAQTRKTQRKTHTQKIT